MNEVDQLSKVVKKFKNLLRLHGGDVKIILNRFCYLKQKLGTRPTGIRDVKLVLTSVYCYTRTPKYGRKIVGPSRFINICKSLGFDINRRDLWRYKKLYFKHGFYKTGPITNAISYFEAGWYDISKDLLLPETAKNCVLSLLKEIQDMKVYKRSPQTVVAAAIYCLNERTGVYLTQSTLADYFGISEVSLRNAAHEIESYINNVQNYEER